MTTIVIKPSSAEETKLLTDLLKKMNVEADIYDMPNPNNETTNAIKDVENRKGKKVENAQELYDDLGIYGTYRSACNLHATNILSLRDSPVRDVLLVETKEDPLSL